MIDLSLDEIAHITAGEVFGTDDGSAAKVTGPVVIDSRQVTAGGLFAALPGEHVDGHDFADQAARAGAMVLATHEVVGSGVIVTDVVEALSMLATEVLRRIREVGQLKLIAITGSQAKTSVKDLVARIVSEAGPTVAPYGSYNNEIGVPITVLRADFDTRFLVLEMGARGLGHIAHLCRIAPPDVGVVLNVGSAHLGEFGSPAITAQAKGEIVEALSPAGAAVLNADDPLVSQMRVRTQAQVLTFGRAGDVAPSDVELDADGDAVFELSVDGLQYPATVPQTGLHQGMNAAAAVAIASAAGISVEPAIAALRGASTSSPMRMERTRRSDGLLVINDAYNANPESMTAALRSLAAIAPGRCVAVLGEMLELGEHSAEEHRMIGRLARDLGITRIVAVGAKADVIAQGAPDITEVVADVDAAVRTLTTSLQPHEVVLVKASRGVQLERVARRLLDD